MMIKKVLNCLAMTLLSTVAVAQNSQPNFILIMADDLGYGDLGVYGSTLIKTPNLDQMAAQGVHLTSFYSSANVCTAARGGLLTGRYPIRLDLVADVARPTNEIHLAESETTVAETLKSVGYATAIFGKWHLGSREEWSPLNHGFDEFYGVLHSNDMSPFILYQNGQQIEEPVNQSTLTQRYTEQALRFMEENQDDPFLIYLPHTFPHVPLLVSEEFEGQSEAGLYGDVVETLDWSIGTILNKVQELGLDENTLVIFTSDNGPWFEGSSGPLRSRKATSWEGGLRVPFIARWPGVIPAGSVSHEPAMNIDIYPTLTRLGGSTLPASQVIDGKNILPLLANGEKTPHEALLLFNNDRIAAVRSGRWKLIVESFYRTAIASFDNPSSYYAPNGLLFDLEKDPSETYSFTRENPSVATRLRKLLEDGQKEFPSAVLSDMWNR